MPGNETFSSLWPLLLYAGLVVFLLAAILTLSYFLGQHHKDRATNLPYEGGIQQTGSARLRFSAQFYLVAMLFVIFLAVRFFLHAAKERAIVPKRQRRRRIKRVFIINT